MCMEACMVYVRGANAFVEEEGVEEFRCALEVCYKRCDLSIKEFHSHFYISGDLYAEGFAGLDGRLRTGEYVLHCSEFCSPVGKDGRGDIELRQLRNKRLYN